MFKGDLKKKGICAYSSGDRAPASGAGSAGSIPARRTTLLLYPLMRAFRFRMVEERQRAQKLSTFLGSLPLA
jgi:hypothetical protein